MASTVEMKMVLTGPRAGNTENINGHVFVDGECTIIGQDEQLVNFIRFMSTYGAYPEGSQEHTDADEAYKKLTGESDGVSDTEEKKRRGKRKDVSGGVQSSGKGSAKKETAGSTEDAGAEAGAKEEPSDGAGHEHSGDAPEPEAKAHAETPVVNNKLLKAIYSLDPENEDHWVKTGKHVGKPKVSVIEEAYGDAGVTRSDVEEVAPEYDREAALEKLISEL